MQLETFLIRILFFCTFAHLQSKAIVYLDAPNQQDMPVDSAVDEATQFKRFQQMATWGFSVFEDFLAHFDSDPVPEFVLTMLTNETFHLIVDVMSQDSHQLSEYEIVTLVNLANMYFARNSLRTSIVELAYAFVLQEQRLPSDEYGEIRKEIISLIQNGNFPVHIGDDVIELEGLDVTLESKIFALHVLSLGSSCTPDLRIKNMPIDVEIAAAIQTIFKPHLTSITFENCSFIYSYDSDFQFDFSSLWKLTHFKCINCISKDLLSMLETVKSHSLINLTIFDCNMDERQQQRLMQFLQNQSKLQCLTIAKSLERNPFPKVTGDVLNLEQLKYLDLTGSTDIHSFAQTLQQCKQWDKLKHLNLVEYWFNSQNFESLLDNLHKMPNLEFLGLHGNAGIFQRLLINLHTLEHVEELMFDRYLGVDQFVELVQKIQELPNNIKISSKNDAFSLTRASMIPLFTNIDLTLFNPATLDPFSVDSNFDAVTRLKVKLRMFNRGKHERNNDFFHRFCRLEFLNVKITSECNLDYLKILLKNNPTVRLELYFWGPFAKWKELYKIVELCRPTKITLDGAKLGTGNVLLLPTITNIDVWGNLRHLKLESFPLDSVIHFLNAFELPKLQSLIFAVDDWLCETFTLPSFVSVQELDITILCSPTAKKQTFVKFLSYFPKLTTLRINVVNGTLCDFDPNILFSNLRQLEIFCSGIESAEALFSNLKGLPYLTDLVLKTRSGQWRFRCGRHFNFKSLLTSMVNTDNAVDAEFFKQESIMRISIAFFNMIQCVFKRITSWLF